MTDDVLSVLVVLTLGVLSPGPDFLLVVKNSVGSSQGRAFATVAGIAAGLLAQVTAIALGFSVITPEGLRVVQLGGAVFLAWIGVRTLLAARRPPGSDVMGEDRRGQRSAFLEGLGCNLANPKAFLFYASMFAHMLPPRAGMEWRIALPLVFVGHAALAWTLVVLAVRSPPVARRLTRAQHRLVWIFGFALLLLATLIVAEAW